jgi:hypothetical protein
MINVMDHNCLKKFMEKAVWGQKLDDRSRNYLFYAFEWRTTHEGHEYWARIRHGEQVFTQADHESLVYQLAGGPRRTPPPPPPEEDIWL